MKLVPWPWVLAGLLAASTAFLALRTPARPSTPAPLPVVTAPAPPTLAEELAALRRCSTKLQAAEDALARADAIRKGTAIDRTPALLDLGPCAGDARALAELEARIEAEVAARVREAAERRLTARDGRRADVRKMVEQFLAIDGTQSTALMEYVCAVREQRADIIEEVRASKLDLKAAAELQDGQREEILADIERLIGKDKYTQLRSVGGLGKLGDLFECS